MSSPPRLAVRAWNHHGTVTPRPRPRSSLIPRWTSDGLRGFPTDKVPDVTGETQDQILGHSSPRKASSLGASRTSPTAKSRQATSRARSPRPAPRPTSVRRSGSPCSEMTTEPAGPKNIIKLQEARRQVRLLEDAGFSTATSEGRECRCLVQQRRRPVARAGPSIMTAEKSRARLPCRRSSPARRIADSSPMSSACREAMSTSKAAGARGCEVTA